MLHSDSPPRERHGTTKAFLLIGISLFVLLVMLSTQGLEDLQQMNSTRFGTRAKSSEEGNQNESSNPFIAPKIVQQYIQWHSASVLQTEKEHNHHRTYAVAYLSPCLDRAGNYLHNFINSIVWGIITNRTVLVQFDETAAPFYKKNSTSTSTSNIEDICGGEQHRIDPYVASWLPRYEEFSKKVKDGIITPIPIDAERQIYDNQNKIVAFPQIPDILSGSTKSFFRNEWSDHALSNPIYRTYISDLGSWHRITAGKLFFEGSSFLYGLLLVKCFPILDTSSSSSTATTHPKKPFSLALHSRHTVVGDTGEYINTEIDCLQRLLPPTTSNSRSQQRTRLQNNTCTVYLMSDRSRTSDLLIDWITNYTRHACYVVVVTNSDDDASKEPQISPRRQHHAPLEHGDRAGYGYWQDIISCSRARNAIIGDPHRSSYQILYHLIEYHRQVEFYQQQPQRRTRRRISSSTFENSIPGENLPLPPVSECSLPHRSPSMGYDYGPGTPTFRHWTRQEPLAPNRILDQYRNNVVEQHPQRYAVTYFSPDFLCHDHEALFTFWNHLIWAMALNRTLVWKPLETSNTISQLSESCAQQQANLPCPCRVKLASWIPSMDFTVPYKQNKNGSNETNPWISDALSPHVPVVTFPDVTHKMDLATIDDVSLLPFSVTNALENLFQQGSAYLYGLLFDESTILQQTSFQHSNESLDSNDDKSSISIAMDGSFLTDPQLDFQNDVSQRLTGCLEQIRQSEQPLGDSRATECYIYAANPDHVATTSSTIQLLQAWLSARNCSLVRTNDYLADLLSASKHARSAFWGRQNSSTSDLLLSIVEYHRQQEIWKLGRSPPLIHPISTCWL